MMTSERDLLRCPFCGGEPSLALCGFGTAEVECLTDECGTRGPRKPSVNAAISAWNRRAQHSTAEPYLWGLAAEGKSPYLDVADSRKEAETMAEFANRHIDSSGPRYCVVPLYVGAVPRHSTAEPVAEVEQSGMTFEQWYAQYHEDACVMYGGLSGNPKDVAHDAWDAARAIEAANGISAAKETR